MFGVAVIESDLNSYFLPLEGEEGSSSVSEMIQEEGISMQVAGGAILHELDPSRSCTANPPPARFARDLPLKGGGLIFQFDKADQSFARST